MCVQRWTNLRDSRRTAPITFRPRHRDPQGRRRRTNSTERAISGKKDMSVTSLSVPHDCYFACLPEQLFGIIPHLRHRKAAMRWKNISTAFGVAAFPGTLRWMCRRRAVQAPLQWFRCARTR
jgi:hypothetical protein